MSKAKVVFFLVLSFILGVAIASFFVSFKTYNFYFFALNIGCFILVFYFWKDKKKRFIFLLVLLFLLGVWRFSISLPNNTPDKIWFYNGSDLTFQAVITSEVEERIKNQRFEISPDNFKGEVLVTTDLYPEYTYGDIIKIDCNLKKPEKIEDFSYDKYLARYNIYSLCYYPDIEVLGSDKKLITSIYSGIFSFKNSLKDVINENIPEPEAGLASAMVLGYKKGIDQDTRDDFSRAGISHIAAISGLHISILVVLVFNLLLFLGVKRNLSFYVTSFVLFVYIIMIGAPASALRAGLMGFLVLLAMHIGRLNNLKHSLMLVAFVLLLANPKLLIFDIGFQLSFLAVLGIAYLLPFFREKTKKRGLIWDIFWVSLSAQLFTLPIVVYNFKIISLISPLANLLVLWTLPVVIISIFSALFLSFIFPALSFVFFLPAWIFLRYIVITAQFMTNVPFSSIEF